MATDRNDPNYTQEDEVRDWLDRRISGEPPYPPHIPLGGIDPSEYKPTVPTQNMLSGPPNLTMPMRYSSEPNKPAISDYLTKKNTQQDNNPSIIDQLKEKFNTELPNNFDQLTDDQKRQALYTQLARKNGLVGVHQGINDMFTAELNRINKTNMPSDSAVFDSARKINQMPLGAFDTEQANIFRKDEKDDDREARIEAARIRGMGNSPMAEIAKERLAGSTDIKLRGKLDGDPVYKQANSVVTSLSATDAARDVYDNLKNEKVPGTNKPKYSADSKELQNARNIYANGLVKAYVTTSEPGLAAKSEEMARVFGGTGGWANALEKLSSSAFTGSTVQFTDDQVRDLQNIVRNHADHLASRALESSIQRADSAIDAIGETGSRLHKTKYIPSDIMKRLNDAASNPNTSTTIKDGSGKIVKFGKDMWFVPTDTNQVPKRVG